MVDNNQKQNSHFRIADLCNEDKPREKAIQSGISTLSDTELIALLLGGGMKGKSVLELSKEIYHSCNNSLAEVAKLSIRDMCRKFQGVGPAKAVTLAAALELGARRTDIKPDEKPQIKCAHDAFMLLPHSMKDSHVEEFWAIMLSRSNKVIGKERISSGGTVATVVDIKLIMRHAIEYLAQGIILAHNHPSGNLNPSVQDDSLTKKIKQAAALLDINILDHLIVSNDGYYSYNDEGRL